MAKSIAQTGTKPSAWIVTPSDKGRKSIKSGKVFLEDKEEFEIEIFNPLTVSVLADIKLNGQSISKTGLVVKPGQRVYLDCFIDDKKKFIFSTYQIDGSEESLDATQNNGLLEVFFYKEDIITLDNWKNKMDKVIIERYYPVYYPNTYPTYPWNNIYCGGSFGTGTTNLTNGIIDPVYYPNTYPTYPWNNIYCGGSFGTGTTNLTNGIIGTTTTTTNAYYSSNNNVNCSYTSNVDLSNSNMTSINSIETGRVEKGEVSKQKFTEIEMDFEKNYISSTIIQILPESRKPVEIKEIKNKINAKDILMRESDEVITLIKKLADLHSSGILTDEEFSEKKTELLSKI